MLFEIGALLFYGLLAYGGLTGSLDDLFRAIVFAGLFTLVSKAVGEEFS